MDRSYDYERLISQYCGEMGFSQKQASFLKRPQVYEKDLFSMTPYQYAMLVLYDMCGIGTKRGSKNPHYLQENLLYIRKFLNWCRDQGMIPYNPFEELEELSYKNLLYQMIEDMKITVLYEDTLADYVKSKTYNQSTYALILGLLFDGVGSLNSLAAVREDGSGRLILDGIPIDCSEFTKKAYEEYQKEEIYYLEKGRSMPEEYPYVRYRDFVFKRNSRRLAIVEDDTRYIELTARNLAKLIASIGLSYKDVFCSGVISMLRKEFSNLDDEDFCEVFISDRKINTAEAAKLRKVAEKCRKSRLNELADMCIPYLVKSRYYH